MIGNKLPVPPVPERLLTVAQRFNVVSTLGGEFKRAQVPKGRLNGIGTLGLPQNRSH
jgi:hypothetical protein